MLHPPRNAQFSNFFSPKVFHLSATRWTVLTKTRRKFCSEEMRVFEVTFVSFFCPIQRHTCASCTQLRLHAAPTTERQRRPSLTRLSVPSELRQFVDLFCFNFQKKRLTDFQKCRIALISDALESSDPGASNGGSNVEI